MTHKFHIENHGYKRIDIKQRVTSYFQVLQFTVLNSNNTA